MGSDELFDDDQPPAGATRLDCADCGGFEDLHPNGLISGQHIEGCPHMPEFIDDDDDDSEDPEIVAMALKMLLAAARNDSKAIADLFLEFRRGYCEDCQFAIITNILAFISVCSNEAFAGIISEALDRVLDVLGGEQ